MHVTRDVVRDLLPAYLSGDASADTRSLVEAFAATDPELSREIETLRAGAGLLPATAPPDPSVEKRALAEAQQQLRTRTSTFAMALFFTLLPFSFVVSGDRITFLMVRDAPTIAFCWWLTAAVMWFWHWRVRRRLRVTGL
jgi:anti-sigma factor RsiW